MFENNNTLQVSHEEFEVIEAALHTQSQILNVQASAGGQGALDRLNAVKRVLSTLAQQKPATPTKTRCPKARGFWMTRLFTRSVCDS
ncbi:MAG: hypothetical protein AB8B60_17015 [Sulfitobacter sp.]